MELTPPEDTVSDRRFVSLSAITRRIAQILQPAIGAPFWLKAEIASGRERGGSFYCDLVETNASGGIVAKMACTIWQRDLARIRQAFLRQDIELCLDNGTLVGILCAVQFSAQYGLSLKVIDADPSVALGELKLRKRELLQRLQQEGLFQPNKQHPVPMLPQRIGLITARGSAAYNDFIKTLSTSSFGFTVYLADASMQGKLTAGTILAALDCLKALNLDLVVIARGGGSKTDLYALDNEAIARCIAGYPLPVWTGIGHETDTSVLDHVANQAFKTPTAIAEELVARFTEMKRHLAEAKGRFLATWSYRIAREADAINQSRGGLRQGARKIFEQARSDLSLKANRVSERVSRKIAVAGKALSVAKTRLSTIPAVRIQREEERTKEREQRLQRGAAKGLSDTHRHLDSLKPRFSLDRFSQLIFENRADLQAAAERLRLRYRDRIEASRNVNESLKGRFRRDRILALLAEQRERLQTREVAVRSSDPETVLKRGFALVYKEDGALLKSTADIHVGGTVRTKLRDGAFTAKVRSKEV